MRFHGVSLGDPHKTWAKRHNGKASILGGLGEFPPIEESSSDEGQVVSEQVVFCGAHLPEEAPPFGRGASLSKT